MIGVKASYFEKSAADGSLSTSVKNFRFYCAEMRHWISEPDDVRDPRDPKTRR
ncbi:MAG: hypothetical protein M5R36_11010 [Deltaproteobacteria bacterium]|nr:hypothetical protein [Deltaproteobacteria bacterium]